MTADIITIGDEILIGQVIDTNSAFIGAELSKAGIQVNRIISISDKEESIMRALESSMKSSDITIVTGGLGPTNDDITKYTIANFFKVKLTRDHETFENIKKLLHDRGIDFTEKNSSQADVPENCKVLINRNGTAPGMLFREKGKILLSMPGVPFEMKSIFRDEFLPWVKNNFELPNIVHRTFLTTGVAESIMAERLSDFEEQLPQNMSLAYLPSPGILKLRLNSYQAGQPLATQQASFNHQVQNLENLLGTDLFGYEKERMEEIAGRLLAQNKYTLSVAESCTGGNISHLITEIPGSSDYFKGSVVAYSNDIKKKILLVSGEDLDKYGAVSKQVVIQMADGARKVFGTDFAIATSGIAGPAGGTKEKPLGTVWIAVTSPQDTLALKLNFGKHRERTIIRSSIAALNMLRLTIIKIVEKTVEKV
jgi:nicotinamide-nucleotide amidase